MSNLSTKSLTDQKVKEFMNKIKDIEKSEKIDLSSDEDLSIGVMNLISIEEHLLFTANKTHNKGYYQILNEVRDMRKSLLKRIVKDYEGEVWCISKHLLASSMRLFEVGTKLLSKGSDTEAVDMFTKSYNLYSLFWGLNLKLIPTKDVKDLSEEQTLDTLNSNVSVSGLTGQRDSIFGKLGQVLKKAIDCCRE